MKKIVALSSVFFLLLAPILILSFDPIGVEAQDIGVKVGDWVKYSISGNFSGMSSFDWMRMEFTKVDGTNVTVKATIHTASGTEMSQDMSFDVGSSDGGLVGIGFVIPANLGVEDTVSFSGTNVQLTAETVRTYGGARRTVVGIDYSMPGLVSAAVFWDKATGILLEASMNYGGQSLEIIASSTSLGGNLLGLDWWIWIVVIAAIVAPVAAVAFVLNRRRTVNPSQSTIPPTQSIS